MIWFMVDPVRWCFRREMDESTKFDSLAYIRCCFFFFVMKTNKFAEQMMSNDSLIKWNEIDRISDDDCFEIETKIKKMENVCCLLTGFVFVDRVKGIGCGCGWKNVCFLNVSEWMHVFTPQCAASALWCAPIAAALLSLHADTNAFGKRADSLNLFVVFEPIGWWWHQSPWFCNIFCINPYFEFVVDRFLCRKALDLPILKTRSCFLCWFESHSYDKYECTMHPNVCWMPWFTTWLRAMWRSDLVLIGCSDAMSSELSRFCAHFVIAARIRCWWPSIAFYIASRIGFGDDSS